MIRVGVVIAALVVLAVAGMSTLGRTAPWTTATFEDCARAPDPPSCMVERVAPFSQGDDIGMLSAAVEAGAVSFVRRHSGTLIDAAQGRGRSKFYFEYRDSSRRYPGNEQLRGASSKQVAAAIALAAAAQVTDEPFSHPDVSPLLVGAGDKAEVAQIATMVWEERDKAYLWRAASNRPRGIGAIWRAAVTAPPQDIELLAELADRAENWGATAEAETLARELLKRSAATAEQRRLAQRIVSPPERHGVPSPAEVVAATSNIREICIRALPENGYQARRCSAHLETLGQFGAKRDLLRVADAYLRRARESRDKAEYKTAWFGLASEAYRLAGDRERALASAREGLPFVPSAVRSHWVGMPALPLNTNEERRRAAAFIGDGGTEPVVQLYRAGARDEALETGFLAGYQRYKNAAVAGETPDPRWVVEDREPSVVERLASDLLRTPDQAVALVFHDTLACEGPRYYAANRIAVLERTLAVVAAMGGRHTSVSAHLARSAGRVSQERDASYRAQLARDLAAEWRRALTIAKRVSATNVAEPRCLPR